MVIFRRVVDEDEAGAIIGKNGEKIQEIRGLTGVSLIIQKKQGKQGGIRVMKIEGGERNVEFAKHLVNIRLRLHRASLGRGDEDQGPVATKERQEIHTAASILASVSDV